MNQERVNMYKIVEFCVRLNMEACKIIKDSIENNEVKKFLKGVNDPVTEADFKIQTMLIRGIHKLYPNIKIVGEEEVDYTGEIATNYDEMPEIKLPPQTKFAKQYNLKDICLWIDPIDNTRGFIEGQAQAVTVLIGISYQKKPEIGVIGLPFKKNQSKAIYKPSVVIGSVDEKLAYEYEQQTRSWHKIIAPSGEKVDKPKIVMSPTRKNIIQTIIVQDLNGQKILAGGAGYKTILIAKQQAHLLPYLESYTKKWDSCAGDAIIKALGGFFIDKNGNELVYDPNAKTYINTQGIVCCFVPQYKQAVIQRCKKSKF